MSGLDSPRVGRSAEASAAGGASQAASPTESSQRRERAAIAAQACETCRSRKSKCDEKRPKCSLCTRLNVECKYREPQPTKKDKTLVFIMDTLSRMEGKIDIIGTAVTPSSNAFDPTSELSSPSSGSGANIASVTTSPIDARDTRRKSRPAIISDPRVPPQLATGYRHLTTPHKVLLWPAVYLYMTGLGIDTAEDLHYVMREVDEVLEARPANKSQDLDGHARVFFLKLTRERMTKYADIFFDTYNVFYPLIDREHFEKVILNSVTTSGFSYGDSESTIALLVFALGKMALSGTHDKPLEPGNGFRSGLRGGTAERPPGLDIFNEARKRLGFVLTQCNLENTQILLLTAIYYEACSRHIDFWRACISASMACQVLIKCEPVDWNSHQGMVLKKVYWTCNMIESWYHFDLDLPSTGICSHEDQVPLPGDTLGMMNMEQQQIQLQFLALIALRRLISRIHSTIFEASTNAETSEDYGGPPIRVIAELSRQLESWRALLPPGLQWSDENRFASPQFDDGPDRRPQEPLFTIDTDAAPTDHPVSLDLVIAQLRSRYYYARFMIYRPFVYKALHFPELMTAEDRQAAARCITSCLMWPIAMAPPRERKRLVPYLFAWTQNFMGVLLILRMTTENPVLREITTQYVDTAEVESTVWLLLDWMRDVRQVEGIAKWSWKILEQLYRDLLDP